jgi:predicted enzyme related to lactoylglutathione lyase
MAEESCYFVIQVPDADRGRGFYSGLLGWSFAPGSVAHSHQIEGMMGGMSGGAGEAAMKLYFDVSDIQAAVARVRELGGESDEVEETLSGYQVDCRDDQGTAFSLHQARGG